MNADHGAAPGGYLLEFARALERIEITSGDGAALAIDQGLDAVIERIISVKENRRKALLIGNGGSAAIVSHVQNDLCKAVGLRALVFNETPLLTAMANDHGYHEVFCRPVELWADRGDLLIAVSSSGESDNILKAAALAKDKGCHVVTFTGFSPTQPVAADRRREHLRAHGVVWVRRDGALGDRALRHRPRRGAYLRVSLRRLLPFANPVSGAPRLSRAVARDAVLAAALLVVAALVGGAYERAFDRTGVRTPPDLNTLPSRSMWYGQSDFGAAVALACGRGYVDPGDNLTPGLTRVSLAAGGQLLVR